MPRQPRLDSVSSDSLVFACWQRYDNTRLVSVVNLTEVLVAPGRRPGPAAYCLATARYTEPALASFDEKVLRAAEREGIATTDTAARRARRR